MLHWSDCEMTACGYSTACWRWCTDSKAGGPKHELFRRALLEVSPYLCDTLVIRYKSLLKDVQGRHVNSSLKQTHTSLSEWWQQHHIMKGWERETGSSRDRRREREKRQGGGGAMQRKTEKDKQYFCVSHQLSVVQFLLLSSTGNNYQEGWLPGQLALFSLLHASKCFV